MQRIYINRGVISFPGKTLVTQARLPGRLRGGGNLKNILAVVVVALLFSVNLDAQVSRQAVPKANHPSALRLSQSLIESIRLSAATDAESTEDDLETPGSAIFEELFPNGDFELGLTVWTMGSLNGWPLIIETGTIGLIPHSGTWASWLGGGAEEISVIEQLVIVPRDSPILKYWHWIESADDLCGADAAGVVVNAAVDVDAYSLCITENTGGWVLHSVDMSAYAGHAILLSIVVVTDGVLDSSLYVDDVFFQFDGGGPNAVFADGFESGDDSSWIQNR